MCAALSPASTLQRCQALSIALFTAICKGGESKEGGMVGGRKEGKKGKRERKERGKERKEGRTEGREGKDRGGKLGRNEGGKEINRYHIISCFLNQQYLNYYFNVGFKEGIFHFMCPVGLLVY